MAGIFGATSKENCIEEVYLGTFFLQDRAQDYCGIAWKNSNGKLKNSTHKGWLESNYSDKLDYMKTNSGIGVVSTNREPVSGFSNKDGLILCYDGNIANHNEVRDNLLKQGENFTGYQNPEEITDSVLISKMVIGENNFEKGIERVLNEIQGDFSLIALSPEGIYGARGWGRKPLILGKNKEKKSYALSSESVSFINNGFEIERDVNPGEIVFLDETGVHEVKKFNLSPIRYGTFEWVYTANPSSVIDGRSVELVRNALGKYLAEKIKDLDIDIVSPIPDSGRCHADGLEDVILKNIEGAVGREVFKKFPYCGRSFTPADAKERKRKADMKLIPVKELVEGNRILLVDDSIVKGNQTRKQTSRLKEMGAKAVYGAIASPPITSSCRYGKSIKKDEDCLAKRMNVEEIKETRGLDGLVFTSVEDLENAIKIPREKLCLECFGY